MPPAPPGAPLLSVRDLSVSLGPASARLEILRGVSFDIAAGEVVGLVGESGCGKSMTALALLGLLSRQRGCRLAGQILFEGQDLFRLRARQLRPLVGNRLSMVFQEPMSALDPVFTIGEQISGVVRAHRKASRAAARTAALEALARVEIPDPAARYDAYPHQLSGGMRQRAMIAMAIVCGPRLLVADEPTTALDVTVQAQIIDLLRGLCRTAGMALLLVTHDLGLVAQSCERVLTMYAGQLVESGATATVIGEPAHPYTSGLLRAMPALAPRHAPLPTIPGRVLPPNDPRPGCRFEPRCAHAQPPCTDPQPLHEITPAHAARCWRAGALALPGIWP